jgi:RNA polymerase sigma-70 factor (ECF subfamily)
MRGFDFGRQALGLVGMSSRRDRESSPGFEELAMPLFDSLYNFAHWMARDTHDAEDIVQETYLKALRGFASFQPGTNFRAWMFRILRNTFLSSRSKLEWRMTAAMNSEEDGPDLPGNCETPDSILIRRSESESVQRAINDLPAHSREVLLLCEVEEMSYREVAEVLAIPIGTVMSRLARARKAIRDSLGRPSRAPASAEVAQEGHYRL